MAAEYYTILTNDGIAYENDRKAKGLPIKLTKMSVGDGGGSVYNPDARAKALKREVWRGDINSILQDIDNPSWLILELTLPDDVGGFYVREGAVWTDTGVMYAILKYPESYKPVAATSGSGKEFYLKAIFQTSNAANVVIQVDESIVKATRTWVIDYVGQELAKLDSKQSVRVATTANIALSGAQIVDGVAVVPGDRVLVKDQNAGSQNGIYIVSTGAWPRAADANTSAKVTPQLTVGVEQGIANGDSFWFVQTDAPINLGTTAISFAMFYGRTGVAAGSYQKVTVDVQGRVVAGSNPTTLAGFGILDAFTKMETAKAVSDAVDALVGAAPAALDQIFELAKAINNDPNFAVSMMSELGKKAPLLSPKFTGVPETPTPSAGSAGPQVANMSALATAVAAASRQFKTAVIGVSSNITLTAAQMGNAVQFNSGSVTLALPSLADVGNGASVMLRNPSASATQNIVVASSGSIVDSGSTVGSMALKPLEWAELASSGSAWFVVARGKLKEVAEIDSPNFTGSPTAITAPLGTNTAQLATMAALWQAVNAFKRNYSGNVVGVPADVTLTGAQTGFAFNATAPVTITLPPSSDAGSGGTFVIRNVSSGPVTVEANSGKIFEKNNTVTATAIQPGEWIELQASTSNYFINKRGTLNELGKVISDAMASFGIGGYNVKSGVDINTLTQGGLAYCINPTNSPVGTDGQSSANGYLLSFQYMDGSTYCAQVFIPSLVGASLDTMHFRRMTAGAWGKWITLASTGFVEQFLAALGLGTNRATLCADVDAQDSSGFFSVTASGTKNLPFSGAGFLLHFPWSNNSAALQFYVAAAADKLMYRAKTSGNWRPWKDLPSLDGVLGAINNTSRSFRTQAAVGIAASMQLNSSTHIGALLQFNADGLAVTLPKSVDVPDGSVITLRNPRTATQTLVAGSGGIVEEGGVSENLTLQSYEWIELSSSGGNWFVSARGKLREVATLEQVRETYAPLANPSFTGQVKVPTAAASNDSTLAASTAFVQRAVKDLAPSNNPSFTGSVTAPTQKVNDASKLVATTEFVEQSKRNYSGPVLGFSSNMALSAAQSGRLYQANANNLTVTLPAAGDAPAGTAYAFRNPTSGTLSISAGNSTLVSDVTVGTLVLQPGEYVELVNNTSTNWFVSSRGKLGEVVTVEAMNAAVTAAAPPGQVGMFALANPPTGWLKRNGAAYSRKAYAQLFAAIGTKFGAGDGSTTFNVPDDRELVEKVWTDGLNAADPGRELFSTQAGQNEAHAHTGSTSQNGAHQHSTVMIREKITSNFVTEGGNAVFGDQMSDGTQSLTTSVGGAHTHTLNINDSGGSEVRVANRAYLGCIKY